MVDEGLPYGLQYGLGPVPMSEAQSAKSGLPLPELRHGHRPVEPGDG